MSDKRNSIILTPVENIIAFDWLRFERPHAPAIFQSLKSAKENIATNKRNWSVNWITPLNSHV